MKIAGITCAVIVAICAVGLLMAGNYSGSAQAALLATGVGLMNAN